MWKRMRSKTIDMWSKFKFWVYALLVSVGVIIALPAAAVTVEFTYTRATEYTDLTPMPIAEIAETRLYCNGTLIATELGADESFNPDMTPATYDCYATHIDIYGRESNPSNTVQKVVLPGLPNPPVLD